MKLPAFRISHRIALIALVGVVGVVAVSGLFMHERNVMRTQDRLQAEAQLAEDVTNTLENQLFRLRTIEKNFFLNKTEELIDAHAALGGQVEQTLETLELIVARNQHRDIPEEGALTSGFQRYMQAFGRSVDASRRLGLNPQSGLQQDMRTANETLAKQLSTIPYPPLRVDAAAIFSAQKDFVLSPTDANRAHVAAAIETLRKRPRGVFGTPDTHGGVMATLDAYQGTFEDFASTTGRNVQLQTRVAATFADLEPGFVRIRAAIDRVQDEVAAAKASTSASVERIVMISVGGILLAVIAGGFIVWRSVALPISRTAGSMRELASGRLDVEVPGLGRRDEIGEIASAFDAFRENTIRKVNEERDAEDARQRQAQEREERERVEKEQHARELEHAVEMLAGALSRLADGDVAQRLEEPFTPSMEKLRADFNHSAARLQAALQAVGENANAIHAGSEEIRNASDDLSRRTEQQAASVEQTAAALEQLVTTLQDSSRRADEAGALVARTRAGAERSGVIVQDAVAAMDRIEQSSTQIGTIIGVIDEIAFQISLLALNAGIEAARAGEAGRGFAVVAQEVRELAQRAANAAKQINTLISASGEHVKSGVSLVGEAGQALNTIVVEVKEISENVMAIVEASREQATGLNEINIAVSRIDQGTQQNAAMVEQSTAASHKLAGEASALNDLLSQFKLGRETAPHAQPVQQPAASPGRAPVRSMSQRIATVLRGGGAATAAAVAVETAEDGWEEF